jgi:peptidyl-prolyl cis-trans isomerase A (cyclophilin A)
VELDMDVVFETTAGRMRFAMRPDCAPNTARNFTELAARGFYDGTIIHRVVPKGRAGKPFVIQGGDPTGTGRGGPGYKFEDEFQSGRRFDRPGLLAMANSGANSNSCQFFITVANTAWLNNKHTIFGEVISGQDIVDRLANVVPKGPGDRPKTDVAIKKLTISKTV